MTLFITCSGTNIPNSFQRCLTGPGMVNIQDAMDAESLQCFGGSPGARDSPRGNPGNRGLLERRISATQGL